MANNQSNGGSADTPESLRAELEDLEATAAFMRQMARDLDAMAEQRKSFDVERFASFLQMKGPDMRIRVWAGIRSPEGFQWYKEWMARKKALMEQVLQHLATFVQAAILWEEDLERRERQMNATLLASPSVPIVTGGDGVTPDEVDGFTVRPSGTDDPESVAGGTGIAGVATRESLPTQQGGAQISEGDPDLAEAQKLIKSIPPKGPLEPPPVIDAAFLGVGAFFAMGSTIGWEPDVSEREVRKGLILYPGERQWEDGTIRRDGRIVVNANGVPVLSDEERHALSQYESVWEMPPSLRGIIIEKMLAATEYRDWHHIGQTDRGYFPLIDFQNDDTVLSVKTANTGSTEWMNDLRGHIRILSATDITINGRTANKVLDLRVQPGGGPAAKPLVGYGAQFGVDVIINEYP